MPGFGDASYWEDRYKNTKVESSYDWLETWPEVKETIEKNAICGLYHNGDTPVAQDIAQTIKQSLKVLNIGCGNGLI